MSIVGRDPEQRAIHRFLDDVRLGVRGFVLAGVAGIGKTTLWRNAIDQASGSGFRVISTRGTEAEARLPFSGLNDLIGDLFDEVRDELPDAQRHALDAALLRSHSDVPPAPLAVSFGVLNALRAVSSKAPVLVAIDDAPWLDQSTASAVEFVLRRLDSEPIGLITSVRTTARAAAPPPIVDALPANLVTALHLERLTPDDLDRLLRAHLDIALPPSMVAKVHAASDGNPFHAIEIGRVLKARDLVSVRGPLPLARGLGGLLKDRLDSLTPSADAAVTVTSALSQPEASVIERAIEEYAMQGLDEAVASGVLVRDGDRVRFSHPLLAAEAYDRLSDAQRRGVHRLLATIVSEPEERARHMAMAITEPDEAVAADLERAAERARERGAPDGAAELAELAVMRSVRGTEGRHRRVIAVADYRLLAGDIARARSILEDVLPDTPPGDARAQVLQKLGGVRQLMDDWAAADALLSEALRHARDVRRRIEIKLLMAGVSWITGWHPEAGARHVADAMRLADELGDPEVVAGTIGHYAAWEWGQRGVRRDDLLARVPALEPYTVRLRTMDHPNWDFAFILLDHGDARGFRRLFEPLLERAERVGDYSSLPFLLSNIATEDFLDGNADLALSRLARAERLARATGQKTSLAHMLACRVSVLGGMGESEEAWEAAAEALRIIADTSWNQGAWGIGADLALLELSRGDAERAHRLLVERGEAVTGRFTRSPESLDIEALVALGRLGEARARLELVTRRARRSRAPAHLADAERAGALVSAAEGDLDGASAALDEVVAWHESQGRRFEVARTLLMLGDVHRRARRRAKAREAFIRAVELFDALQARSWASRARESLRRSAGERERGDRLTPTQLEVARLAASGMTNRQVGDRLFMSPHTVEAHLTAIYRALEIRSRAELGGALAGTDPRDTKLANPG